MTARDFVYWLQGFFEVSSAHNAGSVDLLDAGQVRCIKNHLALVFKHEIDPQAGGPGLQKVLQELHDKDLEAQKEAKLRPDPLSSPIKYRC